METDGLEEAAQTICSEHTTTRTKDRFTIERRQTIERENAWTLALHTKHAVTLIDAPRTALAFQQRGPRNQHLTTVLQVFVFETGIVEYGDWTVCGGHGSTQQQQQTTSILVVEGRNHEATFHQFYYY